MKINSVAGFGAYVTDLAKTKQFYSDLGLILVKQDNDSLVMRVNWYQIKFLRSDSAEGIFAKEAKLSPRGSGLYIHLNVDDVDEFYKELVKLGYTPSSKPKDWPSGNREFVIRDPDGYKLVIFKKL